MALNICNEKGEIVAGGKLPCNSTINSGLSGLQNLSQTNLQNQIATIKTGVDGPTGYTSANNTVVKPDWSEKFQNVSGGIGSILQGIGALKNQQNQYGQQPYYDPNMVNQYNPNAQQQNQNQPSTIFYVVGAVVLLLAIYLLFFNK